MKYVSYCVLWVFIESFLFFIHTNNSDCKLDGISLHSTKIQLIHWHVCLWLRQIACDLTGKDRTWVICWTQIAAADALLCVCLVSIYMTWFVEDAVPLQHPSFTYLLFPLSAQPYKVWFLFNDLCIFFIFAWDNLDRRMYFCLAVVKKIWQRT